MEKVWLITPNESEAGLLTGVMVNNDASAEKAAHLLLKMGIQNVIITLGENGCLLCNESGSKHFKSFKVTAVDTTAAGDVFNGALANAVSTGKTLHEAIIFATAAAALSVKRAGAQPSIPTLTEIETFLNR